jgi:hypothetical protein
MAAVLFVRQGLNTNVLSYDVALSNTVLGLKTKVSNDISMECSAFHFEHRGRLLNDDRTFSSYNVYNMDTLLVVPLGDTAAPCSRPTPYLEHTAAMIAALEAREATTPFTDAASAPLSPASGAPPSTPTGAIQMAPPSPPALVDKLLQAASEHEAEQPGDDPIAELPNVARQAPSTVVKTPASSQSSQKFADPMAEATSSQTSTASTSSHVTTPAAVRKSCGLTKQEAWKLKQEIEFRVTYPPYARWSRSLNDAEIAQRQKALDGYEASKRKSKYNGTELADAVEDIEAAVFESSEKVCTEVGRLANMIEGKICPTTQTVAERYNNNRKVMERIAAENRFLKTRLKTCSNMNAHTAMEAATSSTNSRKRKAADVEPAPGQRSIVEFVIPPTVDAPMSEASASGQTDNHDNNADEVAAVDDASSVIKCIACNKVFKSKRGLTQHSKACKKKAKTDEDAEDVD